MLLKCTIPSEADACPQRVDELPHLSGLSRFLEYSASSQLHALHTLASDWNRYNPDTHVAFAGSLLGVVEAWSERSFVKPHMKTCGLHFRRRNTSATNTCLWLDLCLRPHANRTILSTSIGYLCVKTIVLLSHTKLGRVACRKDCDTPAKPAARLKVLVSRLHTKLRTIEITEIIELTRTICQNV
jgi:hypothetical protein